MDKLDTSSKETKSVELKSDELETVVFQFQTRRGQDGQLVLLATRVTVTAGIARGP